MYEMAASQLFIYWAYREAPFPANLIDFERRQFGTIDRKTSYLDHIASIEVCESSKFLKSSRGLNEIINDKDMSFSAERHKGHYYAQMLDVGLCEIREHLKIWSTIKLQCLR